MAKADPDRVERTAQERYAARRLHISELLDGMHAINGLLDGEGAEYVNQAIRFLARPADHDTRTAAQRRADALVAMGRFVVEHHDIPTGVLYWHHHHHCHEQHFSLEPFGAGHFHLHTPIGTTHDTRPPRLTLLGH